LKGREIKKLMFTIVHIFWYIDTKPTLVTAVEKQWFWMQCEAKDRSIFELWCGYYIGTWTN